LHYPAVTMPFLKEMWSSFLHL